MVAATCTGYVENAWISYRLWGFFPPFVPFKICLKMCKYSCRSSCQFHTNDAPLTLRGFQKTLCLSESSWDSSLEEEEMGPGVYITPHWGKATLADRFTLVWGHLFLRVFGLKMMKRETG